MRSIHAWVLMAAVAAAVAAAHLPAHADGIVLSRLTPALDRSVATDLAAQWLAAAADTSQPSTGSAAAPPPDRSPRRAFLYSVLVPGAGEFWAGSGRRAALFVGLEVAGLTGLGARLIWNNKGKDLEDDFRARAAEEYNPWNYLAWRDSRNSRFSSITHALPCSSYVAAATSSTPIREAIADCGGTQKQQFYELIGKYDQFVAGWNDIVGPDGNHAVYAQVDSAENFHSDLRESYEDDRNESNRYRKRWPNAWALIVANHVISAIDAARVARARNLGQSEAVVDRRTRLAVTLGGSRGSTPMLLAWRPLE